jgi:hypothetical protein
LNGTYQLLAYADVNPLGDSIDTMKKNIKTLTDAIEGVGPEVNVGKTNMLSRHQNAGQNSDKK